MLSSGRRVAHAYRIIAAACGCSKGSPSPVILRYDWLAATSSHTFLYSSKFMNDGVCLISE